MNFFLKDISEVYEKKVYGSTVKRSTKYPPKNGVYVFEREKNERIHLEVVKGKRHVNPDGSVVFSYPGDEDFGAYGKSVYLNRHTDAIVNYLQDNPDKWGPEDIYEFKKTLC